MRVCSVDDCNGKPQSRGWCMKHYKRWQRHGDVSVVLQKRLFKVGRSNSRAAFAVVHGHKRGNKETPTYISWKSMRSRCINPNSSNYKRYGAKGIKVCQRWDSFINFLADMGERPPGTTLDRINGSGNYEPDNCRWADHATQMANRKFAGKTNKHVLR